MSFYTSEGRRSSLRAAGIDPPDQRSDSVSESTNDRDSGSTACNVASANDHTIPCSRSSPVMVEVPTPPTQPRHSSTSSLPDGVSEASDDASAASSTLISYVTHDIPSDPPTNPPDNNHPAPAAAPPSPAEDSVAVEIQRRVEEMSNSSVAPSGTQSTTSSREPPASHEGDRLNQLADHVATFIESMEDRFDQHTSSTNRKLQDATMKLKEILESGFVCMEEQVDAKLAALHRERFPSPICPVPPPDSPTPPPPPPTAPPPLADLTPPRPPDPPSSGNTPVKVKPVQPTQHHTTVPTPMPSSPVKTCVVTHRETNKQAEDYHVKQVDSYPTQRQNIEQRVIVVDRDRQLKFPSFNPKSTSYCQFKALCLIEAKQYDSNSQTMVMRNTDGHLVFNKNMSIAESEILFSATLFAEESKLKHSRIGM